MSTLRRVATDPILRRVELAFASFSLAETATWLATLVYAYERGGTREAGVISVLALGVAVVVAPFAAYAGDRFAAHRALAVGFIVQASTMATAAGAIWTGHHLIAYAAMIDLVTANVVMSSLSDAGMFVGPLITALVLTAWSPAAVFACFAVTSGVATVMILRARIEDAPMRKREHVALGSLWRQVAGGATTLVRQPTLRVLVVIMSVTALSVGSMDVMVVTVAQQRLGGDLNVGVLAAAVGLGAVLGSMFSVSFIRRPQLAYFAIGGSLAMSIPLIAVVGADHAGIVLAGATLVGGGQSVVWVVGNVALQRWAPADVVARVFGINESMQMMAMACGAGLFSIIAERSSLQSAAAFVGLLLVAVAGLSTWRFVASGADMRPPAPEVTERLQADPILAPLDARAIERLAIGAIEIVSPSGATVVAEGDRGDRYYLVVDGRLQVLQTGVEVGRIGPGGSFGEVALLRDVPRSATVVCLDESRLLTIGRDHFIEAVTGHPSSESIAAALADRYSPPAA